MDTTEAMKLLETVVAPWRQMSYSDALNLVDGDPIILEVYGESRTRYFVEIEFFWDFPHADRDIFGIASIDDGEAPFVYRPLSISWEYDSKS